MVKNKFIPIITLLLVFVALFGVLTVPTSAYVTMYDFDYSTSYFNSFTYDLHWLRTDGRQYYYNGIQNIMNYDYDVYTDTNLWYDFVRVSADDSPYGEFNPYNANVTLYERFYRFANSTSDFGLTANFNALMVDDVGYFKLMPYIFILDDIGNTRATLNVDARIGYTIGDNFDYDELVIYTDFGYQGVSRFSSTLEMFSFDLGDLLTDELPSNVNRIVLYSLNVSVTPYYHGCGVVNYLAYDSYRYITLREDGLNPLLPDNDISPYVSNYMRTFARLFTIEILPGLAIYNILSLALAVPIGIAIIRKV